MSMQDDAGLGLAVQWIQQALITPYEDNFPLRPAKNGRKSLKWTSELESLRQEVRQLSNRCWADNEYSIWELYREAQQIYRKEVCKASKETWRTFCSSIKIYLGRLGYTGLYLGTLKLGWGPWWFLLESAHNPRGKSWIPCLLLTSPTQLLWNGVWYPALPAAPHMWTGG
jgi:hypothetical protein